MVVVRSAEILLRQLVDGDGSLSQSQQELSSVTLSLHVPGTQDRYIRVHMYHVYTSVFDAFLVIVINYSCSYYM